MSSKDWRFGGAETWHKGRPALRSTPCLYMAVSIKARGLVVGEPNYCLGSILGLQTRIYSVKFKVQLHLFIFSKSPSTDFIAQRTYATSFGSSNQGCPFVEKCGMCLRVFWYIDRDGVDIGLHAGEVLSLDEAFESVYQDDGHFNQNDPDACSSTTPT